MQLRFKYANEEAILPESFVEDALKWHEAKEAEEARRSEEARERWQEWQAQHSEEDGEALILQALKQITPDCDYNDWIAVGMALAGIGDHWFHAWNSWSAGGSQYSPKETATKWKSFRGKEPSPEVIFGIAKRYGFQFPKRKGDRFLEPDPVAYARYVDQERELERVEAAQTRQEQLNYIERCFKRSLSRRAYKRKGFAPQTQPIEETAVDPAAGAIVPYGRRNNGRLEMEITPDTVPTLEEWIERGRPNLIVQPEDRLLVMLEMILKGYKNVLIADIVGGGKSRTAGEFFEAWDASSEVLSEIHTEGVMKGYYASSDYRRPSNASIERIPAAVSGAGLIVDESKRTPLGEPYTRRAKPGETPDIPGLCIHEDAYQTLVSKGYTLGRGKDSSFCQTCPMFNDCAYLKTRAEQQSEPVLRTHISKLSVGERENVIAFIDEAGISVEGSILRKAHISDIDREIGELASIDPRFYAQIAPILKAVKNGMTRAAEEQGRYGLSHHEVRSFLPTAEALQSLVFNQCWEDGITDPWEVPTLSQISGRIKNTLRERAKTQLGENTKPEHREKLVNQGITPGILPRLLSAIARPEQRTDIRIDGQMIRVRYGKRPHASTLAKMKTVFYMDATPDRGELARNLGISEDEIVTIRSPKPSFDNLTIKVVEGIGKAGRNRDNYDAKGSLVESPYSVMNRIKALADHRSREAIAKDPNTQIGVLDLKAYIDRYDDIPAAAREEFLTGYHFNDSRNTNRFGKCNLMFIVGTPVPNIGDLLSEWNLKTGRSYTAETAPPAFRAWVNCKVTAELIQSIGRPRAQHRPDEQIEVCILSNLYPAQIKAIEEYYPGCTIERVNAYDICPESAPKGYQTTRGVIEAITSAIRAGEKPNIAKIADQVGVSKGRISQILKPDGGFRAVTKSLVLLYGSLNSETKLSELPEQQRLLALYAFPHLVDKLDEAETPESVEESLDEFIETAEILGYESFDVVFQDRAMLGAVPKTSITRLIGFFMGFLPRPFLEDLERDSRSIIGVAV